MICHLRSRVWFACVVSLLSLSCHEQATRSGVDGGERTPDRQLNAGVGAHAEALTAPTIVNVTATADTHVTQGTPTFNYGNSGAIKVTGVALTGWEAGLIKFDAAAIRTAVGTGTLQSASLQLTIDSASLGWGNSQVDVSRMNMPWTEGGATWLCANDTDNGLLGKFVSNCGSQDRWGIEWWSLLPRPFDEPPSATVSLPFGQQGTVTADVTSDVQAVVSGGAHNGWLLTATAGLSSVWVRFSSRESATPPKLVLTVVPSCTPTGPDTDCNGVDDDCDGTIDDAYTATTTNCGTGACARTGATSCASGVLHDSCTPGVPAGSDTTCNGVDDNCNGVTDEGFVPQNTACGLGACASVGVTACVNGTPVDSCSPGAPALADATCDGVDDDCDGQIDENYSGAATTCAVGGCRATGNFTCANHEVVDGCLINPVCIAELNCNDGLDNDGDSLADCRDRDCACSQEVCGNFLDDDRDGHVDCADIECQGTPACSSFVPDPAAFAPPLDPAQIQPFFTTTEFLYAGANAVQVGVAPGTIRFEQAAVVKGRVLGVDGNPLPVAVVVRVQGHSEFGSTETQQDGRYQIVVNGGGPLTLDFSAQGYVHVQRSVQTPWQDYAIVPDVIITALDSQATTVMLPTAEVTVARGSVVTDTDGTRQATLLFPQNLSASARLPNGTAVALPKLTVRATEYTVGPNGPKAMPAPLPPTTAYTYAVELSVDEAEAIGASSVEFSAPVPFYIENFVSVPVGKPIPLGYYDRKNSRWIPLDNGQVIAVLGTTSGAADIDWDGDGVPETAESLQSRGLTAAERTKLASLYPAGTQLWRASVGHFTSIDLNPALSVPDDFASPPEIGGDTPSRRNPQNDTAHEVTDNDCVKQGYSTVGCINRSLSESIPIAGTPYSLHYNSSRHRASAALADASRSVTIDATGPSIPASLRGVDVEVTIAGQVHRQSVPVAPNQKYTFTWDGRDDMGRTVYGSRVASIKLCYAYPFSYVVGGTVPKSFSKVRSRVEGLARVPGRDQVFVDCTRGERVLQGAVASDDLGGWTLSVVHTFDPIMGVVFAGDGSRRASAPGVIESSPDFVVVEDGMPVSSGFGLASDGTMILGRSRAKTILNGTQYLPIELLAHRRDGTFLIANTNFYGTKFALNSSGFSNNATAWDENGRVIVGRDGNLYAIVESLCCPPSAGGSCSSCQAMPPGITPATKIIQIPYVLTNTTFAVGTPSIAYEPSEGSIDGAFDVDANGTLYVVTVRYDGVSTHTDVVVATPDGTSSTLYTAPAGTHFNALTVADDSTLYLAEGQNKGTFWWGDPSKNKISKIDRSGNYSVVATHDQLCIDKPVCDPTTNCFGIVCAVESFAFHPTTGSLAANITMGIEQQNGNYAYTPSMILELPRDGGAPRRLAGDPGSGWYRAQLGGPARYTDARWLTPGAASGSFGQRDVAFMADRSIAVRTESWRRTIRSGIPSWMSHQANTLIPSADGHETYVFNQSGRHLSTLDSTTGNTLLSFGYNERGQLVSLTDDAGNITTIVRDADGAPTAIRAPFGQSTQLSAPSVVNRRLTSVTAPDGAQHSMTYKGLTSLLETLTDPRGTQHSFQYDDQGRLLADGGPSGTLSLSGTYVEGAGSVVSTSPMGRVTRYDFSSTAEDTQTVAVTQPDGTTSTSSTSFLGSNVLLRADGTKVTFDAAADPIWGMMAPLGGTTTTTTPAGRTRVDVRERLVTGADRTNPLHFQQLQTRTTVNGRTYTATFDPQTRTLTATTPAGRSVTRVFDAGHRLTRLLLPGRAAIDLTYDPLGRLSSVVQQDGSVARTRAYDYDATSGFLSEVSGPRAIDTESYTTDAVGRVTELTIDSAITSFMFSLPGDLLSVTPPSRASHEFTYDASGLPESYLAPAPASGVSSAPTTYAYDADRVMTSKALASGGSIELSYRPDGKLGTLTSSHGAWVYSYAVSSGQLTDITAADGTSLSFTYDGPLPTATTWSGPADSIHGVVAQTYDNDFRVADVVVNGSHVVSFGRDGDGLLTTAGALTIVRSPASGDVTGTTLGQLTTSQTMSAFGEVATFDARHASTNLYSYEIIERDAAGRVIEKAESVLGSSATIHYQYDASGRLTDVFSGAMQTAHYEYDDNGNRVRATRGASIEQGAYDGQDRLISYGAATYAFTADGALATKSYASDSNQYDYDEFGALRTVALPGGRQIEYEIDSRNRRIGKKMNGIRQWGLLYLDDLRPVAQLDGDGNRVAAFVYGTRPNVPDYIVRGTQIYRVVADERGSVRLVVNPTDGSVAQRIDYDEFGRVLSDTNPGFQPFGFAGGLYDADTGLVRFGARDYDPVMGRWTAKDPILFGGGQTNLYTYVGGDPINWIDPSGLYTTVTIWDPVGYGESSFGHVSVDVNGTAYSFGPGGMHVEPAMYYEQRNEQFRGGTAYSLDLSPELEEALDRYLRRPQGDYNFIRNNCGDPIERFVRGAFGTGRGDSVDKLTPAAIGGLLQRSGLVDGIRRIESWNP